MEKLGTMLFLFLIFGAASIWMSLVAYKTYSWQEAEATFVSFDYNKRVHQSSSNGSSNNRQSRLMTYSFNIDDQNYLGGRYTATVQDFPWDLAIDLHEKKNFPIYYNPENPNESVYKQGFHWALYLFIIATLAIPAWLIYEFKKTFA